MNGILAVFAVLFCARLCSASTFFDELADIDCPFEYMQEFDAELEVIEAARMEALMRLEHAPVDDAPEPSTSELSGAGEADEAGGRLEELKEELLFALNCHRRFMHRKMYTSDMSLERLLMAAFMVLRGKRGPIMNAIRRQQDSEITETAIENLYELSVNKYLTAQVISQRINAAFMPDFDENMPLETSLEYLIYWYKSYQLLVRPVIFERNKLKLPEKPRLTGHKRQLVQGAADTPPSKRARNTK